MDQRKSRAFWVVPAQPIQQLFGMQGDDPDPVAATVLMVMVAGMSMNDGFNGLPAYHISISQRELVHRLKRFHLSRKAVGNALARLEKRGHLTRKKAPSDGTRKGPNVRITYRIDLLADQATAFHSRGASTGPSTGPNAEKMGPSSIQTEVSDREQKQMASAAPSEQAVAAELELTPLDDHTTRVTQGRNGKQRETALAGTHSGREWAKPYYEPWVKRFGGQPDVGFLRKKLEPLEHADGRDVTIGRWLHFLPGLNPRFFSTKGDPFKNAVLRFAGAPAAYDDPDWHLSDRDRAELAQLTEGL